MVIARTRGLDAAGRGAPPSRDSTTVLTWVLPHLIAHVTARGYDTTRFGQIPGLRGRDLNDPDTRVADIAAADAWKLGQEITGDDVLGLHMAEAIPAGALDLLEYAFRASPTLQSGLEQLARYGRVVSDRAAARLRIDGDVFEITFGGGTQPQRVEFAIAFLIRIAREAAGVSFVPLEVRFEHSRPESLLEHRAFYRAPVRFDQPLNQLLLARSDVARPLRSADAALSGVVNRRLEKMLAQIPASTDPMASRAGRTLLDAMTRGEPTAAAVAREIGVSERTLHRRLRHEGTSFRKILDTVRADVAASLLQEPSIGTAEIAYLLGYSDPAAFHRAFRRWTGQTPLTFRQSQRR